MKVEEKSPIQKIIVGEKVYWLGYNPLKDCFAKFAESSLSGNVYEVSNFIVLVDKDTYRVYTLDSCICWREFICVETPKVLLKGVSSKYGETVLKKATFVYGSQQLSLLIIYGSSPLYSNMLYLCSAVDEVSPKSGVISYVGTLYRETKQIEITKNGEFIHINS